MRATAADWTALVARYRRTILLSSVLVSAACAFSLTRLRLDIDVLAMLPRGTPAFDDFKVFADDFGQWNELVVLIEGAPLPQLQRFADRLAIQLALHPTIESVNARIDFEQLLDGILGPYLYNYVPLAVYDDLERRLTAEGIEQQVAALRASLAAPFDLAGARMVVEDPLGLRRTVAAEMARAYRSSRVGATSGYYVAPDASALLVFVRPRGAAFDIAFSEQLMADMREAVDGARAADNEAGEVRVSYTGGYVFALEDAATMRGDILRYSLAALATVLAIFEVRDPAEAVRHGGRAMTVTSLTTIAGFAFLGLSVYPALSTMGILVGAGLALAYGATLIVLPALLSPGDLRRLS